MNTNRQLFLVQRYSAMLLAPLVIAHLVLIIIAVRNGLTADEILNRTRDSTAWFLFYLTFVIAVSVHAPIGLRNVLREWTSMRLMFVDAFCFLFAILLFLTGLRAVLAVT